MAEKFSADEARLFNHLQKGFPICTSPYAVLAQALELHPDFILQCVQRWLDSGVLTRFGPLFQIERQGGEFTLCALHAPALSFERIAAQINEDTRVAHNYERTHHLNMWFVLATESPAETQRALRELSKKSGCKIYPFPKEKEYYVSLYLPVEAAAS